MKYSDEVKNIARAIIGHCGYYNRLSVSELLQNINDEIDNDFEVKYESHEYRVIKTDDIPEIMADELAGDEYILGCFNAWFLADVLNISQDVIEAMQQSEAFEAIGKLIIDLGKLGDVVEGYIGADGAGHHFSHYDFSEEEAGEYTVFCVN